MISTGNEVHIIVRVPRGQIGMGKQHETVSRKRSSDRKALESPLIMLMPLVLSLLLLRAFGLELFRVEGVSMQPKLEGGATLFVNRAAYGLQCPFTDRYLVRWNAPAAGEIVVYREPQNEILAVKRVAAPPSAPYEIVHEGIRISDRMITISTEVASQLASRNALGNDEVFLIGDNLAESVDSRYYGPVELARIRGRVFTFSGQRH